MLPGEKIRQQQHMRDDVAALVDFFKNHPPPPDNFMSIPYEDAEDDGRGRWSKIKTMAKRSKSMPREPYQFRLPDSAVAGVTIDGHRHIAISIPCEAAPFGPEDMRSQYPVFTRDTQADKPGKDSQRTYQNEKGTVTVLRPVTEAHEAADDGSIKKACKRPSTCPQAITKRLHPPPLPPHKPTSSSSSAGSAPHDYIGALPAGFDIPLLDDGSAPWHSPRASSRDEGSDQNRLKNQHMFQRSAYPARASSMAASYSTRRRNTPPSIDGVTQPRESPSNEMTMDRDQDDSSHAARGSARCRKAVVRDKKRRDLEAMRHVKLRDQQRDGEKPAHGDAQQPPTTSAASCLDVKEGKESEIAGTTSSPGPTLTLSNLMVVMDMKPVFDTESEGMKAEPKAEPKAAETNPETRASQPSTQEPKERSTPSMTVNKRSPPTPPTSAHGSPPQKHEPSDRTSLTRRREWRAIRETEQRAREAMALAQAKTQQLASSSGPYDNAPPPPADPEVLRLYEAYREHRLRDMERRLRRLERNGDVWLQALLPVLQSMNNTSCGAEHDQPSEGNDKHRSSALRSSSLSQSKSRMLEKLAAGGNHSDDGWSDGVGRSEDVGGFEGIEPLMRELAGGEGWVRNGG
ncbi:hypothetical protein E4U55_001890 [Claviceps digitariae]|nr:hypothetical protein E4U55_001890 [Claviceps digitariae]